ncbi:hypothetical protein QF026_005059 [Streptomyces aurantiacus]|uniref:hypothetical protein n=1 Tax=Streptomyces aurantiacus TaxID=47760 RepID=UPI0027934BD6|nr:hypothetical protein [Streptomyces aurantiacus]MDQ0776593.1 hypothetical protein [Streptomyces aurantiacus]
MNARVPVYDTGMLIALTDRKAKAVALHHGLGATPHRAVVLGPVLAQAWRPRPAVIHSLAGVLKDCTVPRARASEPPMRGAKADRTECIACMTGPDVTDWRRIGAALGEAKLSPRKKPDAVDAWVTLSAVKHGSAVIFTSDPEDIAAYLAVLNPIDVHIQPV